MTHDIKIVEEAKKQRSMHPKKFAMWLFIVSVGMLFAAWTSAYIVKRGDTDWVEIIIPSQFYINTVIIIISSVTLVLGSWALKRDQFERAKVLIAITTVLGIAFMVGQFLAYDEMISLSQHFSGGSTSSSFVYVLSGAHGLHVLGGVVYLILLMIAVFRGKVHSKNMVMAEMCGTYWHFLDVLWLYLFVFLILNR